MHTYSKPCVIKVRAVSTQEFDDIYLIAVIGKDRRMKINCYVTINSEPLLHLQNIKNRNLSNSKTKCTY
jgi:hypothetical protein